MKDLHLNSTWEGSRGRNVNHAWQGDVETSNHEATVADTLRSMVRELRAEVAALLTAHENETKQLKSKIRAEQRRAREAEKELSALKAANNGVNIVPFTISKKAAR